MVAMLTAEFGIYSMPARSEPCATAGGDGAAQGENPADFFLDVISGTFNHPTDSGFTAFDLCNIWETEVRLQQRHAQTTRRAQMGAVVSARRCCTLPPPICTPRPVLQRDVSSTSGGL